MADGIRVELVGGARFAATCDRAAKQIQSFNAASRTAAMQTAGQARQRAPRLTGRLAASITGTPDGEGGFEVAVRLGAIYPAVHEYGGRYWRARHYLRSGVDAAEGVITRTYQADLNRIVGTIEGA